MKKFFALVVLLCTVIIFSTTAQAKTYVESTKEYVSIGVKRDHNLFVDIQKNPSRYISIGGVGTGVSVYIDRESIDVQQYEPPIYIIAFKKVYWSVQPDKNLPEGYGAAAGSKIERYRYDYNERKIYMETFNRDGSSSGWYAIDPKLAGNSSARSMHSASEIAFYLAYNMSFYEKPESYYLQEFFKRGDWITFDSK